MSGREQAASIVSCPACGAPRPYAARYCPACHHDYESLTARYSGVSGSAWLAQPDDAAVLPGRRRYWLRDSFRIGAFLGGLSLLVFALVAATRTELLHNPVFSVEQAVLMSWAIPVAAGLLSLIVPGRFARGPFKGSLLGFAGWLAATSLVVLTGWWYPDGLLFATGLAMHILLATLGAAALRLVLLLVLD